MATLAEQLVAGTMEQAQKAPDIAGNFAKGAELAQHVEQIQQQKQQLEQKKAELVMQKFEKVGTWLDSYSKMPEGGAKKAYGKNFIPNGIGALGLSDLIHPDVVTMMTTDPLLSGFLQAEVRSGHIGVSDLAQPDKIASFYAKNGKQFGDELKYKGAIEDTMPELLKAQDKFLAAEAAAKRAQTTAEPRVGQLQARLDDQAANAVKTINNDTAIKELTKHAQRIDRDVLTLKAHPSVYTLNEIAQSIPSLLGAGAVSSDYKVKEINPQTVEGEVAKLKAFLQSDPNQAAPAGSVKFFMDILNRLNGAVDRQAYGRAKQLGREADTVYKSNPNAREGVANTVNSYKTGEWRGGEPTYDVGGNRFTAEQIKQIIEKNPKAKDALAPEVVKELGL
jgi:hypothetical protein